MKPLFATMPQQSDYAALWQGRKADGQTRLNIPPLSAVARIRMNMPFVLKKAYWNLKEWAQPKIKSEAFKEIRRLDENNHADDF